MLILAKQNRDASVEFYQANPAALHRLVPWLKREIIALFGSRDMTFVTENCQMIMDISLSAGIKSKRLREYLQGLVLNMYIISYNLYPYL